MSRELFLVCKTTFLETAVDRHTDDGVFWRRSEEFPKLLRRPGERSQTFSETSEDCRRLSMKTRRCLDHTPMNLHILTPAVVSMPLVSTNENGKNTDLSWQCAQPENWRTQHFINVSTETYAKLKQICFLHFSLLWFSEYALGDGINSRKSFRSFLSIKI